MKRAKAILTQPVPKISPGKLRFSHSSVSRAVKRFAAWSTFCMADLLKPWLAGKITTTFDDGSGIKRLTSINMNNYCRLTAFLLLAFLPSTIGAPALQLKKGDHIAIVGNALADRMQHFGHLETLIHAKFPEHDLVVRNLAAAGDEVVTRHRSENFGSPDEWLKKVQADVIIALSAEAKLKSQTAADAKDASVIAAGRELIKGDIACTDCHAYGSPDEDATAPDLTGYGSRDWLMAFISNPAHPKFYGKRNDRMPAFAEDKILDAKAIGLIADWLRGDWYEPPAYARAGERR